MILYGDQQPQVKFEPEKKGSEVRITFNEKNDETVVVALSFRQAALLVRKLLAIEAVVNWKPTPKPKKIKNG